MRLKIILNSILFILITIIIGLLLSKFIFFNNGKFSSFLHTTELLYNEKQNYDVVILGPSSSLMAWNSLIAWKHYGITSLNFSFPDCPLFLNKYLLAEVLKYQKPKIILVNLDGVYCNRQRLLTPFAIAHYFRLSLNKIMFIFSTIHNYKLTFKKSCAIIFNIIYSHDAWKNILKHLHMSSKFKFKYFVKWGLPQNYTNKVKLDEMTKYKNKESSFEMDYSNIQDLKSLFSFAKNIDIPIIFFNVTKLVNVVNKRNDDYNSIKYILEKNNCDYIDCVNEIPVSYSEMSDENHLNYWGSKKYTLYISKVLVDKYKLVDKRQLKDYNTWNECCNEFILDLNKNNIDNILDCE